MSNTERFEKSEIAMQKSAAERRKIRHKRITAVRKAMDRELKMDPMAVRGGFTTDSAARVVEACEETLDG